MIQNKCLRSITRAYKATNIKVLEAELGVVSFDIHLDQIVLKSRDNPKCVEVIRSAKVRIRKKLCGKKGKNARLELPPCQSRTGGLRKAWTSYKKR